MVKTVLQLMYNMDNSTAVSAICITLPLFIAINPALQSKSRFQEAQKHLAGLSGNILSFHLHMQKLNYILNCANRLT